MKTTPTISEKISPRLEKGAVVFLKPDSGLIGYGNAQCVSWYSPEIDEFSLYGHNEHYHGYQVSKIVSSPTQEKADFAEHITPEKKNPSKYSANEDPYEHNRELGFDFAVDEITKRTKEYLNE